MVATVLVREVLARASALLQDTVPQFARQPEAEMVDWLNDAQVAITKFLPAACSRIDAIKLKPGTRQSIETIDAIECIPGDGSTPAAAVHGTQLLDVLRNMGADGATPGKAIRLTERTVLDSQSPLWHTLTGAAVSSFMYDPRTPRYFYVTPGVVGAMWVEIAFTAQPIKIPAGGAPGAEIYGAGGSSAVTISVADEFADDLTDYIVARTNMRETEWADATKATAFAQRFMNSLNAKVTALTGNNPNLKQLPFAPDPIGRAK
ncbi:MAG TPA: DUF6682 family protein [Burkholderiaceae bacterium]|nr:DUF6682 family protein [Burkholderiaceae bacterium]